MSNNKIAIQWKMETTLGKEKKKPIHESRTGCFKRELFENKKPFIMKHENEI